MKFALPEVRIHIYVALTSAQRERYVHYALPQRRYWGLNYNRELLLKDALGMCCIIAVSQSPKLCPFKHWHWTLLGLRWPAAHCNAFWLNFLWLEALH